ncbi:MAG TPA: hypothetical protein ENH89_21960, partial [Aurantimonas coralicida]|nr:hypothetical protein [Aurantimonas coralicida]
MTETIGDTLGGVPLDEIEILDCRCADGAIVKARPRKDLPWPAVFMGTHPERGLCFFRVRHRGAANGGAGAVEVWECTEAVRRALARRRQRANARAKDGEARRLQKRHRKVEVKPGLPTPERRRPSAALGAAVLDPKRHSKSGRPRRQRAPPRRRDRDLAGPGLADVAG